jgi:hypothetical protein
MRQFHWTFEGYDLFTCAPDLDAARKVFATAIAGWAFQNPPFFERLSAFVATSEPFDSACEYPIVAMSGRGMVGVD